MGIKTAPIAAENIRDALDEFDIAIKAISEDVIARPGIAGARKAILLLSIEPDPDGGDPNSGEYMPQINWEVRRSVPPKKGHRVRGLVEDGQIVVNTIDKDHPNQLGLDLEEEEVPPNVTRIEARG